MNYDPHSLQVKVETGVNFAMQKELALKTLTGLMQASPKFADFMNDEGLFALLDNIDIRGIDELKAKAEDYERKNDQKQAQMSQMQEQMQQMQMRLGQQEAQAKIQKDLADAIKAMKEAQAPTRAEIDMMKIRQDGQFKTVDAQQKQEKIDMDLAELLARLQNIDEDQAMKYAELDAENARTAVESLHTLISALRVSNEIEEI
jgi:5'-3' exonuclease